MFAKIFGSDDKQVLVCKVEGDAGEPSVRFSTQPEGLGVCEMTLGFTDDDAGWDKRDAFFDKLTEEEARGFINESLADFISG